MAEIGFYHLTRTPLDKALPKLLGRVLEGGGRAMVLCGGAERVASLDAAGRPRPYDDAERLARRFIAALDRPFELDGGAVVQIGASVGIASAPPGGAAPGNPGSAP